jgi:hypothetical protein
VARPFTVAERTNVAISALVVAGWGRPTVPASLSERALSSLACFPTPPRVQVFALMEALQEYPYVTHLDLSYNHLDDAALATVVRLLKYRCDGPHPPQQQCRRQREFPQPPCSR